MATEVRSLREVLAAGMKQTRQCRELRQEEVAERLRSYGLTSWLRGTVAQAEVGARRLVLEEVLLLAVALETTPAELVQGDPGELVELGSDARLSIEAVRQLLSGVVQTMPVPSAVSQTLRASPEMLSEASRFGLSDPEIIDRAITGVTEADRHVARKVGISPEHVSLAAMSRWGHTLAEEREHRLAERSGEDVSARQLQALRGHVTRELMTELEPELRDTGKS
jgi:transcriptional regulator with XRE-family HTH domain